MSQYIRKWYQHPLLRSMASLRWTVLLLVCLLFLVFFSTLAQRFMGIWEVMDAYYKAPIVWVELRIFLPWHHIGAEATGLAGLYRDILNGQYAFPFPGGLSLAIPLLINLLAAHMTRYGIVKGKRIQGFAWLLTGSALILVVHLVPAVRQVVTATIPTMVLLGLLHYLPASVGCILLFGRKAGIVMIHAAVAILILGEIHARYSAIEMHMTIGENQTQQKLYDMREAELAVYIPVDDVNATLTRISQHALEQSAKHAQPIAIKDTDIRIEVLQWYPHTEIQTAAPDSPALPIPTPAGDVDVRPVTRNPTRQDQGMYDYPGAIIRVNEGDNASQPIALTTSIYTNPQLLQTRDVLPRRVTLPGPTSQVLLALRPVEHELPFAITLHDVKASRYPGSNIPRFYSSEMTLSETNGTSRTAATSMNEPLRYGGMTFYQSGVQSGVIGLEDATVLQVVKNTSWTAPYIACGIAGVGLFLQFMLSLLHFTKRETARANKQKERP